MAATCERLLRFGGRPMPGSLRAEGGYRVAAVASMATWRSSAAGFREVEHSGRLARRGERMARPAGTGTIWPLVATTT
jgi:hypothetical protein